ncbi:MAG: STAS domain-containing protein [Dactylosporangium sp.]|nr:STAS domain-containing protein [Dactylosporangium sp.]NNJ60899.1 STAS domain-containing protein [Dactylosporangium sp.]
MQVTTDPAAQPCTPRVIEVVVSDELDRAVVPQIGGLLDDALALRPEEIVVDLTACSLIDAAGVTLLLNTHRQAWRAGGRLVLRSPSPHVQRILEVARVAHVLNIDPDPDSATMTSPGFPPAGRPPAQR